MLIDPSSDRVAALTDRLERRFGGDTNATPTLIDVAEAALAALCERSA